WGQRRLHSLVRPIPTENANSPPIPPPAAVDPDEAWSIRPRARDPCGRRACLAVSRHPRVPDGPRPGVSPDHAAWTRRGRAAACSADAVYPTPGPSPTVGRRDRRRGFALTRAPAPPPPPRGRTRPPAPLRRDSRRDRPASPRRRRDPAVSGGGKALRTRHRSP